jgi:hypothetical protein
MEDFMENLLGSANPAARMLPDWAQSVEVRDQGHDDRSNKCGHQDVKGSTRFSALHHRIKHYLTPAVKFEKS